MSALAATAGGAFAPAAPDALAGRVILGSGDYGGLGEAAQTTFRICALGAIEVDVLRGFVLALEAVLTSARQERPRNGRHAVGAVAR